MTLCTVGCCNGFILLFQTLVLANVILKGCTGMMQYFPGSIQLVGQNQEFRFRTGSALGAQALAARIVIRFSDLVLLFQSPPPCT
jgi:hypothetical protein